MSTECECFTWARTDKGMFLTEHHPNCKNYDPVKDAKEIISNLLAGVEEWANDEDGVHPECWEAYKRAKYSLGQFDVNETMD